MVSLFCLLDISAVEEERTTRAHFHLIVIVAVICAFAGERDRAAGIAGVQFQLHFRCLACRRRNAINAVQCGGAVLPHAARELKGNDSSCGLLVGWMDRYPLPGQLGCRLTP